MIQFKIASPLFKLRSDTRFEDIPAINSLKTVKNRAAAFQIMLLSDSDCAVRCGDELYFPQHCGGFEYRFEIVSDYNVNIYPEGMIPDDVGECADILLSQKFCDVDAGNICAFWAEVDITKNSKSGK